MGLQTLQNSVTATGTIEAVTSVTVGTQVSGIVNKLYVDYNSQVKKGQVIAELDKTNLLSELNTAKANLESAQSSLNYQSANLNRYQTLYKKGLVAADDYENALLTYRQAKEQVAQPRRAYRRHRPTWAMPPSHPLSTEPSSPRAWRKVRPWLLASVPQSSSPSPRI